MCATTGTGFHLSEASFAWSSLHEVVPSRLFVPAYGETRRRDKPGSDGHIDDRQEEKRSSSWIVSNRNKAPSRVPTLKVSIAMYCARSRPK